MNAENSNSNDWLNDKEYAVLCELFHEFNAAFNYLPEYIKAAYYAKLYSKAN